MAKGGIFHIVVQTRRLSSRGAHTKPDFEVTVDCDTWVNICNGKTTPISPPFRGR